MQLTINPEVVSVELFPSIGVEPIDIGSLDEDERKCEICSFPYGQEADWNELARFGIQLEVFHYDAFEALPFNQQPGQHLRPSSKNRPVQLRCGHTFGAACIYDWFIVEKNLLCPKCRQPLISEVRTTDQNRDNEPNPQDDNPHTDLDKWSVLEKVASDVMEDFNQMSVRDVLKNWDAREYLTGTYDVVADEVLRRIELDKELPYLRLIIMLICSRFRRQQSDCDGVDQDIEKSESMLHSIIHGLKVPETLGPSYRSLSSNPDFVKVENHRPFFPQVKFKAKELELPVGVHWYHLFEILTQRLQELSDRPAPPSKDEMYDHLTHDLFELLKKDFSFMSVRPRRYFLHDSIAKMKYGEPASRAELEAFADNKGFQAMVLMVVRYFVHWREFRLLYEFWRRIAMERALHYNGFLDPVTEDFAGYWEICWSGKSLLDPEVYMSDEEAAAGYFPLGTEPSPFDSLSGMAPTV